MRLVQLPARPLIVLVFASMVFSASAQLTEPGAAPKDDFRIRLNVDTVELDVTVTDNRGRPVDGLTRENFQVYENGRRQAIRYFSREDVPVTAGLVIDSSRSMRSKRMEVVTAVTAFAMASHPSDELFVTLFNEDVTVIPSRNVPPQAWALRDALMRVQPDGMTALYDAIHDALRECRSGRWAKRVLLVVSDGADTASHRTLEEVLHAAAEQRVLIYVIGLRNKDHRNENPGVLKKLAAATGGTAFFPGDGREIREDCLEIAREVRNLYEIGYVPSDTARDGSYRRIRVLASRRGGKRLQVKVREGYYAPGRGGQQRQP